MKSNVSKSGSISDEEPVDETLQSLTTADPAQITLTTTDPAQVTLTTTDPAQVTLTTSDPAQIADNMDNNSLKSNKHEKLNKLTLIKYASLVILTLQNATLGLSMYYARHRDGVMFASASAVLMSEVVKLAICVCLVTWESKGLQKGLMTMYTVVILNFKDTLRVCIPSFLYIVQNNLLYLSASNLDAATYQVTYQLKILTTAFFAVVVLKRKLKKWQWLALTLLAGGVAAVQLSSTDPAKSTALNTREQNRLLGFGAALAACFISGFAGIYFEKVLKGSDISVWMRNVQLSLLSLPFGAVTYLLYDNMANIFKGYDAFVWYLVVLQAAGGLIVAVVVKYADNILKGFATSVAIIISCVASIFLFSFHLTIQFAFGTLLVIGSIFLYGYVPKKPDPRASNV